MDCCHQSILFWWNLTKPWFTACPNAIVFKNVSSVTTNTFTNRFHWTLFNVSNFLCSYWATVKTANECHSIGSSPSVASQLTAAEQVKLYTYVLGRTAWLMCRCFMWDVTLGYLLMHFTKVVTRGASSQEVWSLERGATRYETEPTERVSGQCNCETTLF